MQHRISDSIHHGKTVSPFESIGDSKPIDRTVSGFLHADQKVEKIKRLVNKGEYDKDVARYIPRVLNLMYQGILKNVKTRDKTAESPCKDMQNLEFHLLLIANHYTNSNSLHLCFSIKIKKVTNANNNIGDDLITVNNIDFLGTNSQFDWSEIWSRTFDKSNEHNTIYNCFDVENTATFIKFVDLENISEAYSLTNQMKYDTSNKTQKHMLYKQFPVWNCDNCSIAPITDYINNLIFQELPTEEKYFSKSDERIYINLSDSKGYTNEIEKLSRNDSELVLKIELKNPLY